MLGQEGGRREQATSKITAQVFAPVAQIKTSGRAKAKAKRNGEKGDTGSGPATTSFGTTRFSVNGPGVNVGSTESKNKKIMEVRHPERLQSLEQAFRDSAINAWARWEDPKDEQYPEMSTQVAAPVLPRPPESDKGPGQTQTR